MSAPEPETNPPASRSAGESFESARAWADAKVTLLTETDLVHALEAFPSERPPGAPSGGAGPTNAQTHDANALDPFAREPRSAGETRLFNSDDASIANARDANHVQSGSVAPQWARMPLGAERPSTRRWRVSWVLVAALGLGAGLAGMTVIRQSGGLATFEAVPVPLLPTSPILPAPASPSTLASSVPTNLTAAVDIPLQVASGANPDGPSSPASIEPAPRPRAPIAPPPAPALREPTSQPAVLQPIPRPSPPPAPPATVDVAPAVLPEVSPAVESPAVLSAATPVRQPDALPPAPVPLSPAVAQPPAAVPLSPSPAPLAAPALAPAPGPALAAPPSAAAPPLAAVRTDATDTAAIQTVLARYRSAFSLLDAGAAQAVWPSVDANALKRAFDQLQQQTLEFNVCTISVTGAQAEAQCGGTTRYVPKVGDRSPRTEVREWKLSLRKVNEEWLIQTVASR